MSAPRKQPRIVAVVALLALAAIPASRIWLSRHRNHPFERLARERAEERDAVTALAKRDLACEDVEVEVDALAVARGCGKRARYVSTDGAFHLDGRVAPDVASTCAREWATGDEGGAREAARAVHARGHVARVRFPIDAFEVRGFAKLKYGTTVDVDLDADAGEPAAPPVPCLDPDAGEGAICTLPWTKVFTVEDCGA